MKELKISRLLTDSEKTETLNRYLKDVKELSFALTAEEEASLAKLRETASEEFRFFES